MCGAPQTVNARNRHLKDAEQKMFALGREFSSPRFTDRYGDGPQLLKLAEKARAAIAKAEQKG